MENNSLNAFAIYRLPQSTQIKWVNGFCMNQLTPIDEIPDNSFVLSPFNNGNETYYFSFNQSKEYDKASFELPPLSPSINEADFSTTGKESYVALINKAVNTLKNSASEFQKIVLANTKTIPLSQFNPILFFEKLAQEYPNAFVYCAYTPVSGWWLGASPETLITTQNNQFKSIALAGTLPPNAQRSFSQKEIDEQHWVELYIEKQLIEESIPFQKEGPAPVQAGQLTHLQTSYLFGSDQDEKRMFALLKKLNPTPAVAGLPKDKAINFITENEGITRSFYAGFIGTKQAKNLQLFVNLRCLHWHNKQITLFAGAGITADSNPESEWEETQHKMNTLEKFLFIIFACGFIVL